MVGRIVEGAEENSQLKLNNQECVGKLNKENQGVINKSFETNGEILTLQDVIVCNTKSRDIKYEATTANDSVEQLAVCIRSGCKSYGTKTDHVAVLDNLNMTVPRGIIYGLLGSSGCGKTTLLSCILSLKNLDSGEISVLGRPLAPKGFGNLGQHVGYMPQEIALYGDFTICETISFFGWIAGMTTKKIKERMEFLINLLHLPNVNQIVKTLSGGQQRRVSLAAALLHEPELLILDEPTVGLDSVLRETIWRHFSDISKEKGTTVIITTHYIDEAHQANCIALMRKGHFLTEDSPNKLLNQYGFATLEALFFKLSYSQDTLSNKASTKNTIELVGNHNNVPSSSTHYTNINQEVVSNDINCVSVPKTVIGSQFDTKNRYCSLYHSNHMKALLWKNLLWMIRHAPLMLATLVSPFGTVALFMCCIGNNPVDIPIAIVNYEMNPIMKCQNKLICNSTYLSCHYFKYIEEHDIRLISYDSADEAKKAVLKGEVYASIVVKNNYSAALYNRVQDWQGSTSSDMLSSNIDVFRDISNSYVANYIKRLLYDTFQDFLRDYMESCGINGTVITIPIRWETPVYGKIDSSFSEFVVSGVLLLYISFLCTYMTISITMIERNEGLLERILVIGITRTELITSHAMCQFVMMLLQTVLSLVCLFLIFNVTLKGSILLITFLTVLTGCCGMFYGLCLSCVCNTEQIAAYAVVGTGFPLLVLSGILWPLEGMHHGFRELATFLPFTHAIESMRSIMLKGWGITTPTVYTGFISMTGWTIVFAILSVIVLSVKKN